jgi:hypothetical protein
MIELGERDCFCAKPLNDLGLAGQLRLQHLDGNFSFEHRIDALEDGAHPAFADLFGYLITTDDSADHLLPAPCESPRTEAETILSRPTPFAKPIFFPSPKKPDQAENLKTARLGDWYLLAPASGERGTYHGMG